MTSTTATEVHVSKLPNCTFCAVTGNECKAEYDGATKKGPWAFMCAPHFTEYGIGLGTGVGQRLILVGTND